MAFLAGVSLTVSAQFKIGGKTINTKKVINAATDVAHAATLSDEDVAKMAKEYIQWWTLSWIPCTPMTFRDLVGLGNQRSDSAGGARCPRSRGHHRTFYMHVDIDKTWSM